MKCIGTQTIKTPRLTLRRFCEADAGPMFDNWASDPEVTAFLTWQPHKDEEETRQLIGKWISSYAENDYYHWAIVPDNLDEPIGALCVGELNEQVNMIQLGYCIGKKWWHRGYVSEAVSAVIDYFFFKTDVNRIEAQHDKKNPHSGDVMKKCGMTYEGTKRQALKNNRGIIDTCIYAILRDDWKVKRDPKIDLSAVTLLTDRLVLRPWQASDLDDFYEYASKDGVGEMAGWRHHETKQETKKVLESFIEGKNVLALTYRETGKVIGSLGLHFSFATEDEAYRDCKAKEIGYVLSKDYWGRGLMPEAVKAVMKYAFETIGIDILTVGHFAGNLQSECVIKKCGFHFVKDSVYNAKRLGQTFDGKDYLLTKDDYRTFSK